MDCLLCNKTPPKQHGKIMERKKSEEKGNFLATQFSRNLNFKVSVFLRKTM